MIKKILVALDTSPGSLSAQTLAIHLAKTHKASLGGIGVVDELWLESPEAIPLGGVAFKVERDEHLFIEAKKQVRTLEKRFKETCDAENIPCSLIDSIGIPSEEIGHFLVEFDLLIIGKDASFHFNAPSQSAPSVRQLIKDNPRPLIVTGKDLPSPHTSTVLVAFDGTFASSRSLHMALLTGFLKGKEVHIVSVGADKHKAERCIKGATELCKNHGVIPHLHPLGSSKAASLSILEIIHKIHPSLLILGAYTCGEINHFFWGSCAEDLLENTDIPVFFFH